MTLDPPQDSVGKTLAPANRHRPSGARRPTRAQVSRQVSAIITRRAAAAGMSSRSYFTQIIAGNAPRITRAEADLEPVT
jgi:hypothetical protein